MKRNNFQLLVSGFQRGLWPLAILAIALSVLSGSYLTPQTQAQGGQKMSMAPAPETSSGSTLVYPPTRKSDNRARSGERITIPGW